jgi:hypothetical protein
MSTVKPISEDWKRRNAIWACGLNKWEKLVLIAILDSDRLGKGVELYQSMKTIAAMTGLARSTVCAAVSSLVEMEVLEHTGYVSAVRVDGEPHGRVSKYRFHIEKLSQGGRNRVRSPDSVSRRQSPNSAATESENAPDSVRIATRQSPPGRHDRKKDRTEDRQGIVPTGPRAGMLVWDESSTNQHRQVKAELPPLEGSARLKRNMAAARRAAAHIQARGSR